MQLLFTYWVTQAMYGNEPSQLPLASLVSGIVWVQGFTFDATTQLACFFGQQQQLKVPLDSTTCQRPFAAMWVLDAGMWAPPQRSTSMFLPIIKNVVFDV